VTDTGSWTSATIARPISIQPRKPIRPTEAPTHEEAPEHQRVYPLREPSHHGRHHHADLWGCADRGTLALI